MMKDNLQHAAEPVRKPALILLDVYDTLLQMDEVERKVNNLLDSRLAYALWFELFMQYCFVDNAIAQFNDFASIARATMEMTAGAFKKEVTGRDIDEVLELLKQLPVHEGVQEGLSALNDMGLRIAALTNSPEATVCERMERTGLISYFEQVLSAEHVGEYKPSRKVYAWAAKKLDVAAADILMVSTHGWDVAGAQNAGMQTAYMRQPRQMLYPLAPQPRYLCNDLTDLARQLIALPK
jgi:2-haloacid dehalogenase